MSVFYESDAFLLLFTTLCYRLSPRLFENPMSESCASAGFRISQGDSRYRLLVLVT